MNLEDLLDMIDELLDRGMKLPGGRAVVDGEKLRSILDDIVADRTEIISNAKKEAESTIRTAEERAKALVAQEEISKLAQQRANEIVSQAQAKSKEMRKAAQDFVDDILKRADEGLTDNLAEIRKTRAALKPQANNQQ